METLLERFERDLRARGFELVETHLSRVFLGERDVYKLKRAVDVGFVDFRQPAARRAACQAEVELNRRLAPGVYLGLLCLREDPQDGSPMLSAEPYVEARPRAHERRAEEDCEWVVHMRRLPDAARADQLLAAGALGIDEMAAIAERLVAFHGQVRSDAHTAQFGEPGKIAHNVEENFRQVEASIGDYLAAEQAERLRRFQRDFLRDHSQLLEARCAAGKVRDGHGDLRLEHVYREPDGSFLAIDCIEFNERFRFADVCADLAFLVMDLDHHERRDLAEHLVLHYARESQDYALYRLLDFYVSYRAVVRAKVSSLLAGDPHVSAQARERARQEARRYYLLALAAGEKPARSPRVIATAGGIATGKSSIAALLSRTAQLPVLSSDRIRKELLGVPLTAPQHAQSFEGPYDAATTRRVYAELFARAEHVLRSGRSVILDASFRSRAERDAVQELARDRAALPLFVECSCSPATVQARLAQRAKSPSISDGRAEISDAFLASFESLDELPPEQHLRLNTEQAAELAVREVMARLNQRAD